MLFGWLLDTEKLILEHLSAPLAFENRGVEPWVIRRIYDVVSKVQPPKSSRDYGMSSALALSYQVTAAARGSTYSSPPHGSEMS
jgi:hypothetical protein